ncbi:MAG: hypothetical protein HY744_06405 [Deltaproteobacteria bacterium]|nr:hypothetical protein [Deltaproteobacteria bacterium]
MSAAVLTVVFERWADLAAQRQHLGRGGLFVPLPDPAPEPFAEVQVVLVAPDGRQACLRASVVQIAPGAGVALACAQPEAAAVALGPLLAAAEAAGPEPEPAGPTVSTWGPPPASEPAVPGSALNGEPGPPVSATAYDRVRALGSAEKLRLAQHGDRAERAALLKDPNKTIHLYLLKNRGLTVDEVRYLAGFRQANPEALKLIGESREWTQHAGVVAALVCNPKTPAATAKALLARLSQTELRRIAKSSNVPQAIQHAARKMVVGP